MQQRCRLRVLSSDPLADIYFDAESADDLATQILETTALWNEHQIPKLDETLKKRWNENNHDEIQADKADNVYSSYVTPYMKAPEMPYQHPTSGNHASRPNHHGGAS